MTSSLLLYGFAALAEIGGCYAFWRWLRADGSPWLVLPGLVCLVVFALLLTRVDSDAAGRAFAAYGGVYILFSLAWLRLVEGVRPSGFDLAGVALALAGTGIILLGARHGR